MKRIIYSTIFLLWSLTSCELLEEEPKIQVSTENFYQTEDDALLALTSAYAQLKNGTGYYSQSFISNLFASSDQGSSSWKHGDYFRGVLTSTNATLTAPWRSMYTAIRDANNVIYNVPNIAMDEELKARVLGEARFLRALNYFNLVRCFGEVPLRLTPLQPNDTELGLPKSSIDVIYSSIIFDLTYASEHCWGLGEARESYTNEVGRVTNAAAQGLLAKVYLHLASASRTAALGNEGNERYKVFENQYNAYYDSAKVYCDKVIENTDYGLVSNLSDWKGLFDADNGNNKEMLFEIQSTSITGQGSALANLFSPRNAGLSGGGWGGTNAIRGTFVRANLNRNDPRYLNGVIHEYSANGSDYVMANNQSSYRRLDSETKEPVLNNNGRPIVLGTVYTSKYIDQGATSEYTSQQNWHFLRLADVYLMRAEALAEIHKNPAMAEDDINILRQRVEYTEEFNGEGMSMNDFRRNILKERGVELMVEGHRWFDLTRMGMYEEHVKSAFDPNNNGLVQGIRGPEDYVWPIPISETAANKNIE